ncbi:MAG: hypothetical protein ACI87W_003226 [Halieaceae bacterium]|jgi:hypothetical protein
MRKYGFIISGVLIILLSVLVGFSIAMTPAPSSEDKSVVVFSVLFFFAGCFLIFSDLKQQGKTEQ